MSKRKRLKASVVYDIWHKAKYEGMNYTEISNKLDIPYHLVVGADKRLDKYIYHPERIQKKSKTFSEAAHEARSYLLTMETSREELIPEKQVPTPEPELSPVQKFTNALELFQHAVEEFIESQVAPVKQENEELKKAISDERHGNWMSALMNRFNRK